MKKHSIMRWVIWSVIIFMVLTWIIPAAYFSSEYMDQGLLQMGIFDLFNYPITAISYFGHIALFILLVGGFYGILYKIPAYNSFLNKVSNGLKSQGKLVLSVIMILIAVVTSICGVQIGLLLFFPMLISIIILMGYDKIVAALTLAGSTAIGLAGTTIAYSNTYIIASVLGVEITSDMLTKIVVLVLGLILLIFNTIVYIRKSEILIVKSKASKKTDSVVSKKTEEPKKVVVDKVKTTKSAGTKTKNSKTTKASGTKSSVKTTKTVKSSKAKTTAKSSKASKASRKDIKAAVKGDDVIVVKEQLNSTNHLVPVAEDNKKHTVWPMAVSFTILFIVMVLAFFPWADVFKLEIFTNATKSVTGFKLFDFEIFGKLLGTVNAFGTWTLIDFVVAMFFVLLFLIFVYKVKLSDVYDGFISGVKKSLPLAIVVVLIYTCLVIVTYHPFQLSIYNFLVTVTGKFDIVITMIISFISGIFNVEPLYAFQSSLPYLAASYAEYEVYNVVAVAYQAMYGLSMLVAPTSVVLMCVLYYLDIPYTKWIKATWILFVEMFGVFAILLMLAVGSIAWAGILLVLVVALELLMVVAFWKIYVKAGKKGWASLVPVYNYYVLAEIAGYNGWLGLLVLVPVVNIVFMVLLSIKLAAKFGKGNGFAVGLILAEIIFYPILAFGKAEYKK